MDIRYAGPDDIGELVRLRFEFFRQDPELVLGEKLEAALGERLRDYFAAHLNRDFFAALADDNGRLASVSFLAVHEKPANVHCPTGKAGEILNVYTLPEYRRQGLASAALSLLIRKARKENLSYLDLSASEAGKYVYEGLGFFVKPPRSYTEMTLNLI